MQNKKAHLSILFIFALALSGLQAQPLEDIDGNVYKTVTIGTQTWMAENLKTTNYNDGIAIPFVDNDIAWVTFDSVALTSPAYYWYNNDSVNMETFGLLYNAYTVKTGKLCPAGWHVPADSEWTMLTSYLGGEEVAGGRLKESGTAHWQSPNMGADNKSGFNALPGGYRSMNGKFYYLNGGSGWWSSSEYDETHTWSRGMHSDTDHVSRGAGEHPNGLYVRCVRN